MSHGNQSVLTDRWQTPPPHPIGRPQHQQADHRAVQAFYDRLPLISLEAALLYVAEHPGYRLRWVNNGWRAVR